VMHRNLVQRSNTSNKFSRRGFMQSASALAIAHSPISAAAVGLEGGSGRRRMFAYVSTNKSANNGGPNGKGICLFELEPITGKLSLIKVAAESDSASWLSLHPSGQYLYAAHDIVDSEGKKGSVGAYAVDRSNGDLRFLNTVSSQGAGPAHLSIERAGKYVFVANYVDGSIAVLPVLSEGKLGPATYMHRDMDFVGSDTPTSAPPGSFAFSGHDTPHAHMIEPDPSDRFVLQTDLGQDRIYIYHFDSEEGKLTPATQPFVSLPSGDGPRHFTFHPNGRWLYSIQEEASTVVFFHFDSAIGSLAAQQSISTLPAGFAGTNFCSEIMVSRDGNFLYAANRLHDTIAVFSIDDNGRLNHIGETSTLGDYPSQFNLDPSGTFLYACNQRSDHITSFRIDKKTGLLTFTGQYTPVGGPACIIFAT
jgi:6-phosphogluconolactonase